MILIKKISKDNKAVFANFSYLAVLQIFLLLSPLITYPYLIRTVGIELYGTVLYAQVLVTYVSLIVNFGFDITGAKEIASNKNNSLLISEIVSSIYISKFIIWIVCFIIYTIVISSFSFFAYNFKVYFYSFFFSLNELLFPIWFFQGVEKLKYVTCINILVRLSFIGAIFIFVKNEADYLYIPLLNAAGALLAGLSAIYVLLRVENVKFIFVSKVKLLNNFKDTFPLFISSLSIRIYLNANKLVVGSFLGMSEVAIFDLGEKMVSLMKIPVVILGQSVFPKIVRQQNISFVNKVMFVAIGISVFCYLVLAVFASFMVEAFVGNTLESSVIIVRILGVSSIFAAINYFLGANRLVPFGYKNIYMKVMLNNCLFYLLIITFIILLGIVDLYSISFSLLAVEIYNLIFLLYYAKKLCLLNK